MAGIECQKDGSLQPPATVLSSLCHAHSEVFSRPLGQRGIVLQDQSRCRMAMVTGKASRSGSAAAQSWSRLRRVAAPVLLPRHVRLWSTSNSYYVPMCSRNARVKCGGKKCVGGVCAKVVVSFPCRRSPFAARELPEPAVLQTPSSAHCPPAHRHMQVFTRYTSERVVRACLPGRELRYARQVSHCRVLPRGLRHPHHVHVTRGASERRILPPANMFRHAVIRFRSSAEGQ